MRIRERDKKNSTYILWEIHSCIAYLANFEWLFACMVFVELIGPVSLEVDSIHQDQPCKRSNYSFSEQILDFTFRKDQTALLVGRYHFQSSNLVYKPSCTGHSQPL